MSQTETKLGRGYIPSAQPKTKKTGNEAAETVCEVGTVGKSSDCKLEGPGFNPRPGQGLNFERPSFVTPSVDRDVKPLV